MFCFPCWFRVFFFPVRLPLLSRHCWLETESAPIHENRSVRLSKSCCHRRVPSPVIDFFYFISGAHFRAPISKFEVFVYLHRKMLAIRLFLLFLVGYPLGLALAKRVKILVYSSSFNFYFILFFFYFGFPAFMSHISVQNLLVC